MKDRSIRALTRAALVTLAVMLLASCAVAEAVEVQTADPYIELSTQYPAMTVKAGDSQMCIRDRSRRPASWQAALAFRIWCYGTPRTGGLRTAGASIPRRAAPTTAATCTLSLIHI